MVTRDAALATRLKKLRQYGWGEKYHVEVTGGRNSRLDEIQAAILRQKLGYLDRWNQQRREIARAYDAAFAQLAADLPRFGRRRLCGASVCRPRRGPGGLSRILESARSPPPSIIRSPTIINLRTWRPPGGTRCQLLNTLASTSFRSPVFRVWVGWKSQRVIRAVEQYFEQS